MSLEDTIGYQNETPSCIVCGKNVEGGRGFARVNHKGIMVNLCCPGCIETFSTDPEPHMARLTKVLEYRAFRDISTEGEPHSKP